MAKANTAHSPKGAGTGIVQGFKDRETVAYTVLDAQVRVIDRSPVANVGWAGGVLGLLATGNFGASAALFSVKIRPVQKVLTHAIAGTLALAGTVDDLAGKALDKVFPAEGEDPVVGEGCKNGKWYWYHRSGKKVAQPAEPPKKTGKTKPAKKNKKAPKAKAAPVPVAVAP